MVKGGDFLNLFVVSTYIKNLNTTFLESRNVFRNNPFLQNKQLVNAYSSVGLEHTPDKRKGSSSILLKRSKSSKNILNIIKRGYVKHIQISLIY